MKFPEQFRWKEGPHPMYRSNTGDDFGFFIVSGSNHRQMKCMATSGDETKWEHVSISLVNDPFKLPTWREMCIVKELFWDDTECVVQFHPPKADHVNDREVLHLWRWNGGEFPMPPKICV